MSFSPISVLARVRFPIESERTANRDREEERKRERARGKSIAPRKRQCFSSGDKSRNNIDSRNRTAVGAPEAAVIKRRRPCGAPLRTAPHRSARAPSIKSSTGLFVRVRPSVKFIFNPDRVSFFSARVGRLAD